MPHFASRNLAIILIVKLILAIVPYVVDNNDYAKQVEHHLEALIELKSTRIRLTVNRYVIVLIRLLKANARRMSPT